MKVKWDGKESESKLVNGGGAQGGLLSILEYLSQSNDCASFLSEKDRYKFISVPLEDLIMIYILYIRSVVENSAVVWHNSLTQSLTNNLKK